MKRLLCVCGTRPEIIKMAPVIWKIRDSREMALSLMLTGQHPDLAPTMCADMNLKVDYEHSIKRRNGSVLEIVTQTAESVFFVVSNEGFDGVVVHGDTAATFGASLAASYAQIPIFHVEAGLRTYDNSSPFPEEMHRRLVAQIAGIHFAPTSRAAANLIREGVSEESVVITGNTIVDSAYWALRESPSRSILDLLFSEVPIILCSAHRRESWGFAMRDIALAMSDLAKTENVKIIIQMHPNPEVKEVFMEYCNNINNIDLIGPVSYVDNIHLQSRCDLLITDSSGGEEEGPTLGTPTIVLRNKSERVEAIDLGCSVLAGTDRERIVTTVREFLEKRHNWKKNTFPTPFGAGDAAQRIVDSLHYHFGYGDSPDGYSSSCFPKFSTARPAYW